MAAVRVSSAPGEGLVRSPSCCGGIATPLRWLLLAYPPVVLVSVSHLGGTGGAAASIAMAIAYCVAWFSRWRRGQLAVSLICALVLPLALRGEMGIWSAALSIPALGAVVYSLRGMAAMATVRATSHTVSMTREGVLLAAGLLCVAVIGLFADSSVLLLAIGVVATMLGALVAIAAWRMRRPPLKAEPADISVVTGTHVSVEVPLRTMWSGHAYVVQATRGVEMSVHELSPLAREQRLSVSMTPRLAGPSELHATIAVVDALGLVGRLQQLTLARLEVTPLARIAEHAARLYLDAGGESTSSMAEALSPALARLVGSSEGVEYAHSRMYLPGDSLRSLDWKHSSRMHKLVVREYENECASSGVLGFNRVVSDVEEADRAVYELVSAGLTAARMSLRVTLASYDEKSTPDIIGPLEGRELVRACLQIAASVRQGPRRLRFVRLVGLDDVSRLKSRVASIGTPAGDRLRDILDLEEKAVHAAVTDHPLTAVLRRNGRLREPGWVMVVTNLGHDGAAATTGLRQLEHEGVRTMIQDVGTLTYA